MTVAQLQSSDTSSDQSPTMLASCSTLCDMFGEDVGHATCVVPQHLHEVFCDEASCGEISCGEISCDEISCGETSCGEISSDETSTYVCPLGEELGEHPV